MDLTAPGALVLLSDFGDMISAQSAREAAVLKGKGSFTKSKKDRRKRPRAGAQKAYSKRHVACVFIFPWPCWNGKSWF
jgi:hypothetical protein